MQLREHFKFDMRDVMRLLPADGATRHKFRQFTLSPITDGRARSIRGFAEDLGFAVAEEDLPSGVGGRLVQDTFSENGYRIEVNKRQSVQARRFSVAHEMGHYYRHSDHADPLADPMYFDLSDAAFYVDTDKEREANEFAEAILFGDGQLAAAFGLLSGDLNKIARYFGVTQTVLHIALEKLRC